MAAPPPRTPPKPLLPSASSRPNTESPLVIKVSKQAISSPSGLNTDGKRKNALVDLGEAIPQVPVDFFLGNDGILPPLRGDIDQEIIVQSLIDNDTLLNGRWAAFAKDPCTYSAHEDVVFADIENIANAILEASGKKTSRTLDFECNPNTAPEPPTRNNNTRPDCYGILANRDGDTRKPRWADIAIPGEFKKKRRVLEENDNWTMVLWSMNHIMREDARRRFVFGFTIENTVMRLWFACRSEVLVSFAFDFIQKPQYVVAFFLRVMFAKEHELGWDPMMKRISPRDFTRDAQYQIDFEGSTYQTIRLISDVGAEALRGRGTRVWEVRELQRDGKEDPTPLVLKDSWVDADRLREGNILEEIRKSAIANDLEEEFDLYFLSVKTFGDVYINGSPDHTHSLSKRGCTTEEGHVKPLKVKVQPTTRKKLKSGLGPAGAPTLPMNQSKERLTYEEKVHHRIVFKDVGITIGEVESLADVFLCLSDVTKGLYVLHRCGWVHRDVSLGNILLVDGVAKIANLEYAKAQGDVRRHGVRTGTPFFMATEVESQRYLYSKDYDDDESDEDDEAINTKKWVTEAKQRRTIAGETDAVAAGKVATAVAAAEVPAAPLEEPTIPLPRPDIFKHNPLHDLESVFWVSVWIVVCSEFFKNNPNFTDEQWQAYLDRHSEFAMLLFCDQSFRQSAISSSLTFLSGFNGLLPQLGNTAHRLDQFRRRLLRRYKLAEKSLGEPEYQVEFPKVAGKLHQKMIDLFDTSTKNLRKKDLKINVQAQVRRRKHMQDSLVVNDPSTRQSSGAVSEDDSRPHKTQKKHPREVASSASAVVLAESSKAARTRTRGPEGRT